MKVKWTAYDQNGKVVIITCNRKIAANLCAYAGGELGSTDVVKIKPRGRRASGLNRKNLNKRKR